MTTLTLEVSDKLAEETRPLEPWLPTIVELTLLNFETQAVQAAQEIVAFLRTNPSPNEVASFYLSQEEQDRLEYLIWLSKQRSLSPLERSEVEERLWIGHIGTMLKTKAVGLTQQNQ